MDMNGKLAGLVRIICAVGMLSALLASCSRPDVGPEPPWNLSADEAAAQPKQHESH